jgi:nucleotide-binding universal stress UspA family protein
MSTPPAPRIGSPLLVPFDGSANADAVLPFVSCLADGEREVILLQVVPAAEAICGPRGEVLLSAADLHAASTAAANAALERAEARLGSLAQGVRISKIVATGDPAESISETAVQTGARTILLSSQGASATGPGGFGSVVGRVVRTAPVPVVVVRPQAPAPEHAAIHRLIVAHDGSERAEQMLPLARDLARRLDAHVHVVSVVQDDEGPIPAAVAAKIDPHLREEAQADARNIAQRRVEAAGAGLLRHGLSATWEVRSGPAAPAIIDVWSPQDVLVITSHRSGGARWMLGSVAEKLIRESPVPVILMRTPPPGTEGKPA